MSATAETTVRLAPPVPPKRCRACGAEGEWPGQPCPKCKPAPAPPATPSQELVIARPAAPSLPVLAATINREHAAVIGRGREMIQHAIVAGAALLEAQAQIERGGWIAWFRTNVRADLSTAYRYMRLAEHRRLVLAAGADSINAAMKVLADVPRRGQGPRGYSDADKRDWVKLADQIGIKPAARAIGISPSTMHRWAGRNSPDRDRDRATRQVTEDRVEALAAWLVERFGGYGYPERITAEVRVDATTALTRVFTL